MRVFGLIVILTSIVHGQILLKDNFGVTTSHSPSEYYLSNGSFSLIQTDSELTLTSSAIIQTDFQNITINAKEIFWESGSKVTSNTGVITIQETDYSRVETGGVFSGGTLNLNGSSDPTGGTLTIGTSSGGSFSPSITISGAGSISSGNPKNLNIYATTGQWNSIISDPSGYGLLTLSGLNIYSGDVTIDGGTLNFGSTFSSFSLSTIPEPNKITLLFLMLPLLILLFRFQRLRNDTP